MEASDFRTVRGMGAFPSVRESQQTIRNGGLRTRHPASGGVGRVPVTAVAENGRPAIRRLAELRLTHPASEVEAYVPSNRTMTSAIDKIEPDLRPKREDSDAFENLLAWTVRTFVNAAGAPAPEEAVASAAATLWPRVKRRGHRLPDQEDVGFLHDVCASLDGAATISVYPVEGKASGNALAMRPAAWAMLRCLSRSHPTELAAAGRKLRTLETRMVRAAVRENFPDGYPFPDGGFPGEAAGAGTGLRAVRILTVGQLCDHAAAAANRLAASAPALLRLRAVAYALVPEASDDPVAHFTVVPDGEGLPTAGELSGIYNRKADRRQRSAALGALAEIRAKVSVWPERYPVPESKSAWDRADSAVFGAQARAYAEYGAEALREAAAIYGITYGGESK